MPILSDNSFNPGYLLGNRFTQTILANLFRNPKAPAYRRQRIETADEDFFDIDRCEQGSEKCIVVLHGLEGNSQRQYVRGLVKIMYEEGWDAVAMNFRGCSGEANRLARTYHSGEIEDIGRLIEVLEKESKYKSIVIAGFSLGGNVTLYYAGTKGKALPSIVKAVVGVSVPVELGTSVVEIEHKRNYIFLQRFLVGLKKKVREKQQMGLLSEINVEAVLNAKDFTQFDGNFTAPVHGFKSADHYWSSCSSLPHLHNISVPALLINAKDDTFLSEHCFPKEIAKASDNFHLLTSSHGGHVGFFDSLNWDTLWSELKIRHFLVNILNI